MVQLSTTTKKNQLQSWQTTITKIPSEILPFFKDDYRRQIDKEYLHTSIMWNDKSKWGSDLYLQGLPCRLTLGSLGIHPPYKSTSFKRFVFFIYFINHHPNQSKFVTVLWFCTCVTQSSNWPLPQHHNSNHQRPQSWKSTWTNQMQFHRPKSEPQKT